VIAEPMFALSTLNCTFATATLSDAVAVKVTDEPDTVAPLDGPVSETLGGVVSGVGAAGVAITGAPPPPPKPGVMGRGRSVMGGMVADVALD
jgi:hypothetical protein